MANLDPALIQAETPDLPAAPAPEVAPEATPAPEAKAPPAPPPKAPSELYQEKLNSIMAQHRESRQNQVRAQQQQQAEEMLRRIEEAKQYGPDAVLRAAGLEPQKQKKMTIDELFGSTDDKDEPEYVKELRTKLDQQEQFIRSFQAKSEEAENQRRQQEYQAWEARENDEIRKFIDSSSEKYQYISALKPMNSHSDLYNGLVMMYNQGYSPSYDDMADLVETRVESLLDHLANTSKFKDWVQSKYGVKLAPKSESPTISGSSGAETPSEINPDDLSDEENMKLALEMARREVERRQK